MTFPEKLWQRVKLIGTRRRAVHAENSMPTVENVAAKERPGLFTQSGRRLFESPTASQIATLHTADPRIEYFRFRIPGATEGDWNVITEDHTVFPSSDDILDTYNFVNQLGIAGNLFANVNVVPLLNQLLRARFGKKEIGIRGTACCVDIGREIITEGLGKIKTPVEILQAGVETTSDLAPMTGFGMGEIGYRSLQWLMQHPWEIRDHLQKLGHPKEDIEAIFPILLIYDREKFSEGSTALPQDPEERANCILAAIVLDYPLEKRTWHY